MRLVEQDQLKEMPEQAESWIAEDGIVSHETPIKKVGEKVPNSEISRPEFRRRLCGPMLDSGCDCRYRRVAHRHRGVGLRKGTFLDMPGTPEEVPGVPLTLIHQMF